MCVCVCVCRLVDVVWWVGAQELGLGLCGGPWITARPPPPPSTVEIAMHTLDHYQVGPVFQPPSWNAK